MNNTPSPQDSSDQAIFSIGAAGLNALFPLERNSKVGHIYAWDEQAISLEDGQGLENLIERMVQKNGPKSGYVLRAVVEKNGKTSHHSMSVPIWASSREWNHRTKEGVMEQILRYGANFLEYLEVNGGLEEITQNGGNILLEAMPMRVYHLSKYTTEYPAKQREGNDVELIINTAAGLGYPSEEGDEEYRSDFVAFQGQVEVEKFDGNPVVPFPRKSLGIEYSLPVPGWRVKFGSLENNGNPCHITEAVRSSNGQKLEVHPWLTKPRAKDMGHRSHPETPSPESRTRVNIDNFEKTIENIYERLENLERNPNNLWPRGR